MTVAAKRYSVFFDSQRATLKHIGGWLGGLVIGLGVSALALLLALKSPPQVWVAVAALASMAMYTLNRLQAAIRMTREALVDFDELGKYLIEANRNRAEVIAFVESKVADDDSNVPEALYALSSGNPSGENVRACANAALSMPSSELAVAHFMRTVLVLGGLFGTVLFFALELRGVDLSTGNPNVLIRGLQGALACTLVGILGSTSIGLIASRIDQSVDRTIWEAEALIGGAFVKALGTQLEVADVGNERDYWQAMLLELRQLREGTAERYEKLGSDVAAYGVALQEVSRQLQQVPQIQVPPQLATLQDSVAVFSSSVVVLKTTVGSLVEAVGAVSVEAPVRMLERLSEIEAIAKNVQSNVSRLSDDTQKQLDSVGSIVVEARDRSTSDLSEIKEVSLRSAQIVSALSGATADFQSNLQRDLGALPTVAAEVTAQAKELRRSAEAVSNVVADLQGTLSSVRASAVSGPHEAETSPVASEPSSPLTGAVESISSQLLSQHEALRQVIDAQQAAKAQLTETQQLLHRQARKLALIDRMALWHERAARAPLMRFLLMPLTRSAKTATETADGA